MEGSEFCTTFTRTVFKDLEVRMIEDSAKGYRSAEVDLKFSGEYSHWFQQWWSFEIISVSCALIGDEEPDSELKKLMNTHQDAVKEAVMDRLKEIINETI